jgi:superfamily II DNA or RNA helicase
MNIKNKLYEYQYEHTNNLVRIINNNNVALDASDTGTGKTYCAVATCKILNLHPIVICPKSVISVWHKVCSEFNVKPHLIVNYEMFKSGRYHQDIIKVIYDDKDKIIDYKITSPKKTIFIFDEVHRCCNMLSENGKLLLSVKDSNSKMLLLSATIADFPEKFKIFFYVLNFIDQKEIINKNISKIKYMKIVDEWINRDKRPMVRIHNMLFPDRSSRMRIDVLGDLFPQNQITATPYTLDKKREMVIQNEYKNLNSLLQSIKDKQEKDNTNIFTQILRSHQRIEILKIPIFVELANDFLSNKYSVVIFVNFTQTLVTLAKMFDTDSIVYGQQTQEKRLKIIDDFQENKTNIIICNIKAGGIGISLHDLYGKHPRVTLISPTWNSIDLVQALGRIHRAGAKTPALQRIIYTANTIEESIADKIKYKLKNINQVNNGDLDLTNIDFQKEKNKV